ncbi:MAG: hypothetical protein HFE90_11315 [Firmicutes bacterium]|nr:hypothetical protein [Bacillota bacterium]
MKYKENKKKTKRKRFIAITALLCVAMTGNTFVYAGMPESAAQSDDMVSAEMQDVESDVKTENAYEASDTDKTSATPKTSDTDSKSSESSQKDSDKTNKTDKNDDSDSDDKDSNEDQQPEDDKDSYINNSGISIYIDGKRLKLEAAPEIVSGRTFVPMREIFEALGADVEWSKKRREVVATSGFDELVLKEGSVIAIHNTEVSTLDAAPYIKDGRTMVPVRYLSEALNYDVEWDSETKRIDIKGSGKDKKESSTGEGQAYTVLGDDAGITYDDAMQKAIRNSPACRDAHLSLSQAERRSEEFNNLYSMNYNFTIMQNRKDLKLLTDWSEKSVILSEEQTAFNITTAMDEISMKLMDIENQKAAIKYKEQQYEINRIKYENGTLGKRTLDSSKEEIKTAQKTLAGYETELEGLYIGLYSTLGDSYANHSVKEGDPDKRPAVEKFLEPEFSVNYSPMEEVNMQQEYNNALANDPYIWYVENNAENADFKLVTYEYNVGGQSYALTKMDLQAARNKASTTKDNLRKTLYSRYNQLIQIENNIDMLEDNRETLRENIDTVRLLYENGVQPKTALEEVLQNNRTISYNLLNLKVKHEQLKAIFEKPYLAPEYMAS